MADAKWIRSPNRKPVEEEFPRARNSAQDLTSLGQAPTLETWESSESEQLFNPIPIALATPVGGALTRDGNAVALPAPAGGYSNKNEDLNALNRNYASSYDIDDSIPPFPGNSKASLSSYTYDSAAQSQYSSSLPDGGSMRSLPPPYRSSSDGEEGEEDSIGGRSSGIVDGGVGNVGRGPLSQISQDTWSDSRGGEAWSELQAEGSQATWSDMSQARRDSYPMSEVMSQDYRSEDHLGKLHSDNNHRAPPKVAVVAVAGAAAATAPAVFSSSGDKGVAPLSSGMEKPSGDKDSDVASQSRLKIPSTSSQPVGMQTRSRRERKGEGRGKGSASAAAVGIGETKEQMERNNNMGNEQLGIYSMGEDGSIIVRGAEDDHDDHPRRDRKNRRRRVSTESYDSRNDVTITPFHAEMLAVGPAEQNDRSTKHGEYAVPSNRTVFFTPLMFIVCGVMLLWEFSLEDYNAVPLSENPAFGPSVETLVEAGAKVATNIVDEGETYRLLSAMFLHAGVIHYIFNMIGFMQVGTMVERVFGWWKVGIIYTFAGVFGTVASAVFVPTQVMVGASGAIFGVFGALWADLTQNWGVYRDKCTAFMVLTVLTAVNIFLGLMPYLDNFAHIGGMVMGFLLGLVFLVQKRETETGAVVGTKWFQRVLQVLGLFAAVVLMITGLSLLFNNSDPSEWCSWCDNISCVEFPRGDDPWWRCDECSTTGFEASYYDNGTTVITCPDSTVVATEGCIGSTLDELTDCCLDVCIE